MATTGNQLTVAKNPVACETVAATLLDLIATITPTTAREASSLRLVTKHVDELFELAGITEEELKELKDAGRNGNGQAHAVYGQES